MVYYCFAELYTPVCYKVNMVIMIWGQIELQNKIRNSKIQNHVNKSSHFAYKVIYVGIILLKIQLKYSLGELGKKQTTSSSWPGI